MVRQFRVHVPAVHAQPTFHLIEAEILDLSYQALVLQVDGTVRLDKSAINPAAWRGRAGAELVGGPNGIPPGRIRNKLAALPTGPQLRNSCTMSFSGTWAP